MISNPLITNYLTIDVEDYYQVSAFEQVIGHDKWENYTPRVENNTRIILDILERYNIKATFFILGWTAKRFPNLVKEIDEKGHEIGCHSYYHRLVYNLSPEEFKNDTQTAKEILEQTSGKQVFGYRAPSYSITKTSLWALDILQELGFKYDSSIFPIHHDRYGIPDAPRFQYKIPGYNLVEYPISTCRLLGRKIPVSGGGYFRLFPYKFSKMALTKINKEGKSFVFYIHPWEIDHQQPRIISASVISKCRHYINLTKTIKRFNLLLTDFDFSPISGM